MTQTHRLLSVAIFLLIIGACILLLFFSAYLIPIAVAFIGLLIILLVRFFYQAKVSLYERMLFVLGVALFNIAGFSFFIFLEHPFFQYATALGIAFISLIYIENAYKYLWNIPDYHISALSNVSSYMHLLSIFFATVSLFNLRFFFGVSSIVTLSIAAVFGLLLFYAYLWSQKVLLTSLRWYSALFALVFVEFVYVLNIWPHLPLVKGVVTLAFVYGMMQILLASLHDSLNPKKVARTLGIVGFVLLIVLVTAQWR